MPQNATESIISWLSTDHGNDWIAEARKLWKQYAGQPNQVDSVRQDLATFLETSIVNAALEHEGDVYGHLLADAIGGIDWEVVAASLLKRVAARVAA